MCNHQYTHGKDKSRACFFHQHLEDLPMDEEGKCLFHSTNKEWKKTHDSQRYLEELMTIVREKNKAIKAQYKLEGKTLPATALFEYDFSEAIFHLKNKALYLYDYLLDAKMNFSYSSFTNILLLDKCQFGEGLNLIDTQFNSPFRAKDSIFKGFNAEKASFKKGFLMESCQLNSYSQFDNALFNRRFLVDHSEWAGVISFSKAVFKDFGYDKIEFLNSTFKSHTMMDGLEFDDTLFEAPLFFKNITFDTEVKFIHSRFPKISNTDYTVRPTTFENITIEPYGKLHFLGESSDNKLFQRETKLHFVEEENMPEQSVFFENVDFNFIHSDSKKQLLKLEKFKKVVIGKNCFKFRHRTPAKTINISTGTQNLVQDWVNTFSHYFFLKNGWDLGIEIVERTATYFKFFYFTNENILLEDFLEHLETASHSFWNYPHNTKQIEQAKQTADPATYINITDILASLHKIYLQIGARASVGGFSEEDFQEFIKTLPNSEGLAESHAIYQQIAQHYHYNPFGLDFNKGIE